MTLIETTDTAYLFQHDGRALTFPRVTSVLALVRPDLREIPADVLHHAAERGRAVHKACWILSGGDPSGLHWPSVNPEVRPYVEGFQAFINETRCRCLDQERLVISQRFRYAGRMDLRAEIGGIQGVLDIKSCTEHPSHRIQCSAYLEAHKEQSGTRKQLRRWLLYLLPTGRYRLLDCDEWNSHTADFRVFSQILGVYRWLQEQNGGNGQ